MNDLDKIEALDRNTAAIHANTVAVQALSEAWAKLTRRADELRNNPNTHTVTAVGVPLAQIRPIPPAPPVGGFSL